MKANNLFGEKMSDKHPLPYPRMKLMTHEWDAKTQQMVLVPAYWVIFPDWQTCFTERMALLHRLASIEPGYAAALHIAQDDAVSPKPENGANFVVQVSSNWSTDPNRAKKVLQIHAAHASVFAQPQTS